MVNASTPFVRHLVLVQKARGLIPNKSLQVKRVKGHNGGLGNELADRKANKSTTKAPRQPPIQPTVVWDMALRWEVFLPPHKVCASDLAPKHRHLDINPLSFLPLKGPLQSWAKWL